MLHDPTAAYVSDIIDIILKPFDWSWCIYHLLIPIRRYKITFIEDEQSFYAMDSNL